MKISDLLKLTPLQITALPVKQLKKVVSTLNSAARKRVNRINQADDVYSPSADYIEQSGGFKTVRGQTKGELISSYTRARQFLESPTSTLKGAREYTKFNTQSLAHATGLTYDKISELLTPTQRQKYFDIINEAINNKTIHRERGKDNAEYYRAMRILAQEMDSGDKRHGKSYYYNRLMERLNEEYEQMQRERQLNVSSKFD